MPWKTDSSAKKKSQIIYGYQNLWKEIFCLQEGDLERRERCWWYRIEYNRRKFWWDIWMRPGEVLSAILITCATWDRKHFAICWSAHVDKGAERVYRTQRWITYIMEIDRFTALSPWDCRKWNWSEEEMRSPRNNCPPKEGAAIKAPIRLITFDYDKLHKQRRRAIKLNKSVVRWKKLLRFIVIN